MNSGQTRLGLHDLIQIGEISDADYKNSLVRVQLGGLKTNWIRWGVEQAGDDVSWWAPTIGQQVVVAFPFADFEQGVILTSLYSGKHPAPANKATISTKKFKDGTSVTYDQDQAKMTVDCVGSVELLGAKTLDIKFSGDINIEAPNTTIETTQTHKGDVTINGNLTVAKMMTTAGFTSEGTVGGAGATITGPVKINGGDVTVDGISVKSHTHPGDSGGTTGAPQ